MQLAPGWPCRFGSNRRRRRSVLLLDAINIHQQKLGLSVLDAVHELGALLHVANSFRESDAGLN